MNLVLKIVRRVWVPAFLLLTLSFLWINSDELRTYEKIPRIREPIFVFFALLLQALVWYCLASGWRSVVSGRTGEPQSLIAAFRHLALFSLGKYLPGKVWGIAARAAEMRRQGIGVVTGMSATVREQFLVVYSAGVVSAALLPLVFPGWLTLAAAATALVSLLFIETLAGWGFSVLAWTLRRFGKGAILPGRWEPSSHVGHYLGAWLLHGLVLVLLYLALSFDPGAMSAQLVALLILGNTVGMLAGFAAVFAPAGIGAREAAMIALLSNAVPLQEAVGLSVIMRIWTFGMDILLGAPLILVSRRDPV